MRGGRRITGQGSPDCGMSRIVNHETTKTAVPHDVSQEY